MAPAHQSAQRNPQEEDQGACIPACALRALPSASLHIKGCRAVSQPNACIEMVVGRVPLGTVALIWPCEIWEDGMA